MPTPAPEDPLISAPDAAAAAAARPAEVAGEGRVSTPASRATLAFGASSGGPLRTLAFLAVDAPSRLDGADLKQELPAPPPATRASA